MYIEKVYTEQLKEAKQRPNVLSLVHNTNNIKKQNKWEDTAWNINLILKTEFLFYMTRNRFLHIIH